MEIYKSDQENWDIEVKGDHSPLTVADKLANELICNGLESAFPAMPIISEERKVTPYAERKHWEYCWLVDPLDGTKEFIKRNGEFTVNIALVAKGNPILGVVYVPVSGALYHATKGEGAYRIDKEGNKTRLASIPIQENQKAVKIVASRSHLNEETTKFVAQYESAELISAGSSLKFLLIAEGKAQVYPRLAPTMEWDTAAAQIVVEESGGRVVDTAGVALQYNKKDLLNPHFIAYAR
ncbi:MAG: 3'(2'),5'-bisphosphate nucleotidase CysQ [Bacteroidetes bacterium]|nr:3'(2'),5'-bisphosphate nucleotidase CysQ [Bacteroidota bacterium]